MTEIDSNSLLAKEAISMNGLFPLIMNEAGPIGVFDSGYGGLTVLKGLVKNLPKYDFLYLGDNARAPYGPRSVSYTHLTLPTKRIV